MHYKYIYDPQEIKNLHVLTKRTSKTMKLINVPYTYGKWYYMAVGTGGGGGRGDNCPPPIFCQPPKNKF